MPELKSLRFVDGKGRTHKATHKDVDMLSELLLNHDLRSVIITSFTLRSPEAIDDLIDLLLDIRTKL